MCELVAKKLLIFHPFLFTFAFIIMPYTQYAGLVPYTQIFTPLIALTLLTFLVYILLNLLTKNKIKSVAFLSPLLIVLYNFGIFYEYVSSYTSGRSKIIVIFISTLLLFAILVFYTVKIIRFTEQRVQKINRILTITAIILFNLNLFNILTQSFAYARINSNEQNIKISISKRVAPLPDIYFIILDEYAAPSQMKSFYDYDVSPFTNYLKQKGFFVSEMVTNSLSTSKILAARLNMNPYLEKEQGTNQSQNSLFDTYMQSFNIITSQEEKRMIFIRNSELIRFLKRLGYRYIHIGSWFAHTRYNSLADTSLNFYGFQFTNELSAIISINSILRVLYTNKYFVRNSVNKSFTALKGIAKMSNEPKFIFAHIICPHSPYVFGPNGEKITTFEANKKDQKELYLGQHIYVSKKIEEFVEQMLSSTLTKPIIVIQGDHGSRIDKKRAYKVFSAIYIPNYKGELWPDGTDSAKTFTYIFKELFKEDFGIN